MKFGRLQRLVSDDGVGRLWLVDDNGTAFAVSGKQLREAGLLHPAIGDEFEFLAVEGRATQLRSVAQ